MSKIRREAAIKNRKGLHARASAAVVRLAESYRSVVSVCYKGNCVSATSIMDLLMLGAGQGSVLILESEGEDAEAAIKAIGTLIDNEFDEK